MMDSGDIDLWLDWQTQSRPAIIVPYVKAPEATALRYRVVLKKVARSGRAQIVQGGSVALDAGVPKALSRMAVDRAAGDACTIEVVIVEPAAYARSQSFDCPAP
jgi:hypothetical protein